MDTQFFLQFGNADVVGRFNRSLDNAGAFFWSSRPAPSASYTPAEQWRYSDRQGVLVFDPPTVERLSPGRYRASIPGYGAEVGEAGLQLSAQGTADRICSIVGATGSGTVAQVDVACTNASGAPADSAWLLMLGSNAPVPF